MIIETSLREKRNGSDYVTDQNDERSCACPPRLALWALIPFFTVSRCLSERRRRHFFPDVEVDMDVVTASAVAVAEVLPDAAPDEAEAAPVAAGGDVVTAARSALVTVPILEAETVDAEEAAEAEAMFAEADPEPASPATISSFVPTVTLPSSDPWEYPQGRTNDAPASPRDGLRVERKSRLVLVAVWRAMGMCMSNWFVSTCTRMPYRSWGCFGSLGPHDDEPRLTSRFSK